MKFGEEQIYVSHSLSQSYLLISEYWGQMVLAAKRTIMHSHFTYAYEQKLQKGKVTEVTL